MNSAIVYPVIFLTIFLGLENVKFCLSQDNVTFALTRTPSNSTAQLGQVFNYTLTITVPYNVTAPIAVEIYAAKDYNFSSVMSTVCSPQVVSSGTALSGISIDDLSRQWSYFSSSSDLKVDRATIYLGNISQSAVTVSGNNSDINVIFSSLVNFGSFQLSTTYIDAVGVSVISQQRIWVGQSPYVWINTTVASWGTNSISISRVSGSGLVQIGTFAVYRISMIIQQISANISVDVYAAYNLTGSLPIHIDQMTVPSTQGASYNCFPRRGKLTRINTSPITGSSLNLTSYANFNLGTVVNQQIRNGPTNTIMDTLNIDITIQMTKNAVDGGSYQLIIGANVNNDILLTSTLLNATSTNLLGNLSDPRPTFQFYTYQPIIPLNGDQATFLNITVPLNGAQMFSVEMFITPNVTSRVQFSRVRVLHVGENFPQSLVLDNSTITRNSTLGDGIFNYMTINLGLLTNLGLVNNSLVGTIVFEITVECIQMTTGTAQETIPVVASVSYGDSSWLSQLNMSAANPSLNNTGQVTPNIYYYWPNGINTTYIGSNLMGLVDVEIPLYTYSQAFSFVLFSLFDTKAVMSICSVNLVNIGEQLLNIKTSDISITLQSTNNDFLTNRAVINVTQLITNSGRFNYSWEAIRSYIRFEVKFVMNAFLLTTNTTLVNKQFYWSAVVASFSGDIYYLNNITFNYNNVTKYVSVNTAPTIAVTSQSPSSGTLSAGGLFVVNFLVQTKWQAVYGMYVEVISSDNSMRVCPIRRVNVGKYIGCLSDFCVNQFSADPNKVTLDLGNVANLAYEGNDTAASSFTISAFAIQNPNLTTGSAMSLDTRIYVGSNVAASSSISPTVTVNNGAAPAFAPTTVSIQARNGTNNLIIGAFNIIEMKVNVPRSDAINSYRITFTIPDTGNTVKMYVCDPYVVSAGYNLPCVDDRSTIRNITYATPDDPTSTATAFLDLGLVPNLKETGASSYDVFTVELPVMPLNTTSDNSIAKIGYSVTSGSNSIASGSLTLTAVKALPPISFTPIISVSPALNSTPIVLNLFSNVTFTVNFTLAESINNFVIQLTTKNTGTGPTLAFYGASFTYTGFNYPCWRWQMPKLTVNSSDQSTATDFFKLEGLITHTGRSRRDGFRNPQPMDDLVSVTFAVVLNDALGVANNLTFDYQLAISFGTSVYRVFNLTIMANLTGLERPRMNLVSFTSAASPNTSYAGDTITLFAVANHSALSTRNAFNVTWRYFLPAVLRYNNIVSWFPFTGQVNVAADKSYITFSIFRIMYTDNMTVGINVTLDPTFSIDPRVGLANVQIPQIVQYYSGNYSVYSEGPVAYNLQFNVSFEPPLGMSSGAIQDCQITASSFAGDYRPIRARPTSSSGWAAGFRGPLYSGNEYLQINLGNLTSVTAALFYPANDNGTRQELATFSLSAAKCDNVFQPVTTTVNGSITPRIYSINLRQLWNIYVRFDNPIDARVFRITPLTFGINSTALMFRVELFGNVLTKDVSKTKVCPTDLTHADYYDRGYLVDTAYNRLWACIAIDNQNGSRCSATFDSGQTWIVLDETVHCITRLHKITRRLYGIGSNRYSKVRSDDNGINWVVITDDEYNTVAALSTQEIQNVTIIRWNNLKMVNSNDLKTNFGYTLDGTGSYYTVNHDGLIFINGSITTQIAYWGTAAWP